MQNFTDPTFWLHVAIVNSLIILFFCFLNWKKIKPEIIKFLWMIRCGFVNENFNMQMDFISYAEHIRIWFPKEPTEKELEQIHDNIEAFREEHQQRCDPKLVAKYVKDLYDIHNGKAIKNFEVTIQGMLMESKQTG